MAINISFNGATTYRPSSLSKVSIDLSGGFPLGPTGLVAIFGEGDRGKPGADESDIANNVYSPEQLPEIQEKYGPGPISDAAQFLFAPASDAAVPSGAQAVYIYKTNNSTRATTVLPTTTGVSGTPSYGTVRSLEYGVGANKVSYKSTAIAEAFSVTGTATVLAAAVDTGLGQTLLLSLNGSNDVSYTIAASANRAALLVNLDAAFVSLGITFTANVSNNIVINPPAAALQHELGYGRTIEIYSTSTSLATFGWTSGVKTPSVEPARTIKLRQLRDLIEEEDTLGGTVVLKVGYSGAGTSADVSISDTLVTLRVDAATVATFTKSTFSSTKELADEISLISGWAAAVESTLHGQLPVSQLDQLTQVGAIAQSSTTYTCRVKRDWTDVAGYFAASQLAEITSQAKCGLPDAQTETLLAGGTKGSTSTSAITDALEALTRVRINSVVPLFSRDATEDISDSLTDAASTYTIAGIHQAVKTHLSLMSTTKNRSERQGYLSLKDTYDNSKDTASDLADARIQLMIQDARQLDSQGTLKWFQPWALASMVAGARGGAPVGTPMTYKFFNLSGIRHTDQSMNTAEEDIVLDFDPSTQYEDAIQAGITFLEHPQSGGFRMVVDNTTYGKDANWVYNRAHVLYAADILLYDLRTQLENIYVGVKNTINAAEVKATVESIMATYLAQGITVSSDDAKNGWKNLTVRIEGSVIYINVTAILVEGLEWILTTAILTRKTSAA